MKKYDKDGFDADGFDRYGFDADGKNSKGEKFDEVKHREEEQKELTENCLYKTFIAEAEDQPELMKTLEFDTDIISIILIGIFSLSDASFISS